MRTSPLRRSGVDHTVLPANTPHLPLPRSSPDGATTEWTVIALSDEAYYSLIDPVRMKGWVGLVMADLQRTVYPYKLLPISCRSGADQWKFAGQRPTFYHWATQPEVTMRRSSVETWVFSVVSWILCMSVTQGYTQKVVDEFLSPFQRIGTGNSRLGFGSNIMALGPETFRFFAYLAYLRCVKWILFAICQLCICNSLLMILILFKQCCNDAVFVSGISGVTTLLFPEFGGEIYAHAF